jgi:amino acid transporter
LLGELVSIGTLFAFVIVGTGIIILRSSNPALNRPFKVPLSPFVPIATVVSAAYLMNALPFDTWLRLIDWMSVGLVVYFAYSYSHSHLRKATDEAANRSDSKQSPPIAALIAILITIALTIYQVPYLLNLHEEYHLKATDPLPANAVMLSMGIRLFAWIVTGVLVGMLMYGKQDNRGGSDEKMRKTGLIISLVNLLVWIGITYWFFFLFTK